MSRTVQAESKRTCSFCRGAARSRTLSRAKIRKIQQTPSINYIKNVVKYCFTSFLPQNTINYLYTRNEKSKKKFGIFKKSFYLCTVRTKVLTTPLSAGSKTLSPLLHLKVTLRWLLFFVDHSEKSQRGKY